jgi:hypothetical protein
MMVSFDVVSLFTKVPVKDLLDLLVESLMKTYWPYSDMFSSLRISPMVDIFTNKRKEWLWDPSISGHC